MKAIIYVRVSTKEQADTGHSLKAQEKECRAFAADMGYAVLQVFVEVGESAKTTDRTQLTLMWELISKNKDRIDALIVWDIDRLSRSPRDYYDIEAKLKANEIKLLSVKGTNDASPIGNLVRSNSVSLSAFENEQKKQRIAAVIKQALKQGRWPWRPPVGYKREKTGRGTGRLIPDKKISPLIVQAFQLMAEKCITKHVVLSALHAQGFHVSSRNLSKILQNPFYCGQLRTSFFPELLAGAHKPLVSKDLFELVQMRLRK